MIAGPFSLLPMHDVFVSYATPDRQVTEAIVHHLESIGIRCFYAPRNMRSGVPWPGQLVEGIKAAKLMVLVLSEKSNCSDPVRQEIFLAVKSGLKLIPFKLEAVDLHPDLEFHLVGQHWLDAINPPLAARIQELGADVCLLLKRDPAPVFPAPEIEPEEVTEVEPEVVDEVDAPEVETEPEVVTPPPPPPPRPSWKRWALIGGACLAALVFWPKAPKVIEREVTKEVIKEVPVIDPATQKQREAAEQKVKDLEQKLAEAQKPAPPPPSAPKQLTPFERATTTGNSLGMKFVSFTETPKGRDLGCIHETRSKDFAAFMADKDRGYEMTGKDADDWRTYVYKKDDNSVGIPVGRGKDEKAEDSSHPVCNVSYEDAQAFCQWLTAKERSQGLIGPKDEYRLPSDADWSLMVGLSKETGSTPQEKSKNGRESGVYPWGTDYPPKNKVGNYADETAKAAGTTLLDYYVKGYTDDFATTAPVMSFAPNSKGFYDLGGNAYEWCEDWYDADKKYRVLRGASWADDDESGLLSSLRFSYDPGLRYYFIGFRCVLVVGSGG